MADTTAPNHIHNLLGRRESYADPVKTAQPRAAAAPRRMHVSPAAQVESQPPMGADEGDREELRVSIVIPTLNEARNICIVLSRIPPDVHQVILVDGMSSDGTIEVARAARDNILVVHQARRGKGNALAHGFAAVTGDVVVMLDADGSADPAEIPSFVAAIEGGADFAKGSRFLELGGSSDITWLRSLGNRFLSGLVNVLHGTSYTDLCYGYNAFRTTLLPHIGVGALLEEATSRAWGDGFEIETLINIRVARARAVIAEVPSYEHDRIHGESNLNTFRDGWRVLRTIIAETRLSRSQPALVVGGLPGIHVELDDGESVDLRPYELQSVESISGEK